MARITVQFYPGPSYVLEQCSDSTSNKVSNIIRRPIDNRKLLLICILLLSHSFIFFRFYFLSIYISLLPTTYKILSNILLSRLIPYAEERIGDHQCGFRRNRSTTDHILCIRQILEKKWEYNEAVHQLFIDFKKAYGSVRREVLYNILMEFGIPKKLVRLIKCV